MQNGLSISTNVDKASADAMADALVKLMETKADQKTIRHAITVLGQATSVNQVSFIGCTLGDRTLNVGDSLVEQKDKPAPTAFTISRSTDFER